GPTLPGVVGAGSPPLGYRRSCFRRKADAIWLASSRRSRSRTIRRHWRAVAALHASVRSATADRSSATFSACFSWHASCSEIRGARLTGCVRVLVQVSSSVGVEHGTNGDSKTCREGDRSDRRGGSWNASRVDLEHVSSAAGSSTRRYDAGRDHYVARRI